MSLMKTVGYVRVSPDKQADRGVSLEAQAEKIRAMAVVHNAELIDISHICLYCTGVHIITFLLFCLLVFHTTFSSQPADAS